MNTIQWKFLDLVDGKIKSQMGAECFWEIGKWQKPVKNIKMCNSGYHSSPTIPEALVCVQGSVVAQVECKGKTQSDQLKAVWENQRIVKAWQITWKAIDQYYLRALEVSLEENPEQENAKEIAAAIEGIKKGVIRSSNWNDSTDAGVWYVHLYYYRANSYGYVGFRCACSRLQQVWAEDILPGLEEIQVTPESES